MSHSARLSITLGKENASRIRKLVERGQYASISAAMDVAAEALLEQEEQKESWWAETLRRCEEAEKHPERLLDADTFFREVRREIDVRKERLGIKRWACR